jgi:hypothetical protein
MRRTILSAILTFVVLTITTFAQVDSDKILAQGNPALTQSMVEKSRGVFEFAFGGVMTNSEKATYQSELIKQWRNNEVETIKTIQTMVEIHDKATGASKEQLLGLQKEMQTPLVTELRNQADKDVLANMLVNAFNRIQGLNVKQGGNLPRPANNPQQNEARVSGGSIPREILGEWVKSNTSNTLYTNGYGGYSTPSGEKVIMHFYADGTYKAAYYVQSSMSYGCTMTVYMPSNGTFSVEGNTLKLNEKSSRTISKDTCVARYNYEKNNKPGSYAYPARLERDQYGTKIVLTMNDGNHNFYFNTGKSFLGGN